MEVGSGRVRMERQGRKRGKEKEGNARRGREGERKKEGEMKRGKDII